MDDHRANRYGNAKQSANADAQLFVNYRTYIT